MLLKTSQASLGFICVFYFAAILATISLSGCSGDSESVAVVPGQSSSDAQSQEKNGREVQEQESTNAKSDSAKSDSAKPAGDKAVGSGNASEKADGEISVQDVRSKPELGDSVDDKAKFQFQKSSRLGVKYLLEKGQAADGSFSKQLSPAVSALCTSALIRHGVPLSDERLKKALASIESNIKPNGGVYGDGSNLKNYETSVSLMCFMLANTDGKYDMTIEKRNGISERYSVG